MAWRRPGDKPLSETMMVCLLTHICVTQPQWVNTLRPKQNGCHFSDDIFKCIFFKEYVWILIKISLKFVPKGPIDNKPSLFQIMAWCQSGAKPSSEPVMTEISFLTCIWFTQPQWVNCFAITQLDTTYVFMIFFDINALDPVRLLHIHLYLV